jgi:hypothetical protein
MVRPSSKHNCLTITYKTVDGVIVHLLVDEDAKNKSFALSTDPDSKFVSLEDLLESLHLKIPGEQRRHGADRALTFASI